MLSQYRARTEIYIDTLRRGVSHHRSRGNALLHETRMRFLSNEDARLEEFRRARKERLENFADLVADRIDRHASCNSGYEASFQEAMREWKNIALSSSKERTLALDHETKETSMTLSRIFDDAQIRIDEDIARIKDTYARKRSERSNYLRILAAGVMQFQKESDEDRSGDRTSINLWTNLYQVEDNRGAFRVRVVRTTPDSAHLNLEKLSQPEYQDVQSGHGLQRSGNEQQLHKAMAASQEMEVKELEEHKGQKQRDSEVKSRNTRRNWEAVQPDLASSANLPYTDGSSDIQEISPDVASDEEHIREAIFFAAVDDDDQRWKSAVSSLENDARHLGSLFDEQFMDLQQRYIHNRAQEGNDTGIDLSLLDGTIKWRRQNFEEKDRRRQEVFNAWTSEYVHEWRKQLKTHEATFHENLLEPAFRLCKNWANSLISLRAEQNADANQLLATYQPIFAAAIPDMTFIQQPNEIVDANDAALHEWDAVDASNLQAVGLLVYRVGVNLTRRSLQSSPQQPYFLVDDPYTEPTRSLEDSVSISNVPQQFYHVPDCPLGDLSLALDTGLLTNSTDLQVAQGIGADDSSQLLGSDNEPNSCNAQTDRDASHDGTSLRVLSGFRRFAAALSPLRSFPYDLISGLIEWISRLTQPAVWKENQAQRAFREHQAQRQRVIIKQTSERALSVNRILAHLQHSFEDEQARRRESANDQLQEFEREERRRDELVMELYRYYHLSTNSTT
ncbi:hypothetical protein H0H87_001922 [Tephrocybe sp. NHM501043]|nr:hypothetical protein H0H87_001922 [Tephrocybe sp. NHM501043]